MTRPRLIRNPECLHPWPGCNCPKWIPAPNQTSLDERTPPMPATDDRAELELPEMPTGPAQGAARVHAEIETPLPGDEVDTLPGILVGASIHEPDGVNRYTNVHLPPDATDETIAAQLLASVLAVAALRGPGVAHALTAKLESLR